MCILMNDNDDYDNSSATTILNNSNSKRDGRKRWQLHTYRRWILRKKPLLLLAAVASFLLFMGIFFMVIGGGIGSTGLKVVGGILFGFGSVGLLISFLISVHAFFFYGTRDQCVQTMELTDEMTLDAAGYSSVGRPSALKSPDSTLKRNGTLGVKKVTLAPELGDYGVVQPSNQSNNMNNATNNNNNSINFVNSQPLHRLPSTGSGNTSRANSMPRTGYIDGSTVGTGGIKITPIDSNQPSPASSISYGGSGGQYYSTGGGGSTISGSSATDTYAYPRSVQLSFDSGNSGSQSQYSTLRSIPVTHLGPGQKQSNSSYREVEYATVNKSGVNKLGNTIVRVEHLPARQQHGDNVNVASSPSQGLMTHVQMGQEKSVASQGLNPNEDDRYRDYDNTIERMPMISSTTNHQQQPQKLGGNASYHEKQMQFQRHQRHQQQQNQQDLHAPRQINVYSLQKQYAPNPFNFKNQSEQQQQHQEHQMQQYKMHYEQEKKQQQLQTQHSKSSAASSARNSMVDDVFEPQPLVYPSARRPMTFEQVTSSKMSVYDNVLANNLKESDEMGGQ